MVKIVVAALVVLAGVALLLRGFDFKGAIDRAITMIRDAGPVVFFGAMIVLPVVPFPMLAFTLTAGTFRDTLGMPLILTLTVVCLTLNLMLTYVLARWVLRPPLEKIITKLGYAIPQVPGGDVTDLIIILRVTPGVPFTAQNYLLGLARIPFGRYVVVSFFAVCLPSTAYVIFGDALLHGRGFTVMLSLGILVAIGAATHLLRKHYSAKAQQKS